MESVTKIVSSIIEMDKEIEKMKLENHLLKMKMENNNRAICSNSKIKDDVNIKNISALEESALIRGKKELFREIFYYSFYSVEAKRDKDNKVIYEDFYKWAKKCIRNNSDSIPFTVSPAEIIQFYEKELSIKYQELCEQAYERLIESEKNKEDEE